MEKKETKALIDSRHLKILAVKKDDLKNSIVFVSLDEDKYGHIDKSNMVQIAEQIQNIEPDAVLIPQVKKMDVQIVDLAQFRNKDLLITIGHDDAFDDEMEQQAEQLFQQAIPQARSIRFVHAPARIVVEKD